MIKMEQEYLEYMKKWTNTYNNLNDKYEEKNKVLFLLLFKMYENKFQKNVNFGVLSQIIINSSFIPLSAYLDSISKEKLVFDDNKNEFKLGNYFCVKEINDDRHDRCISVEISPEHNQDWTRFLLPAKNEKCLIVDYNFTHIGLDNLTPKPYGIKSFEKRIFDDDCIEIERDIVNDIELDLPGHRRDSLKKCEYTHIENETKIFRDSDCFKFARIESIQKENYCLGKRKISAYNSSVEIPSKITVLQEAYGLCPNCYNLDISRTLESYKEAVDYCLKGVDFLDSGDYGAKIGIHQTLPMFDFIPNLNDEIRKRVENAKLYCQKFLDSNKK